MSILDLPSHVLVQVASYLDHPTLKSLATTHPYLTPAAETHLYRRLVLPISNPYHSVPSLSHTASGTPEKHSSGLVCGHGYEAYVETSWEPVKPTLAHRLRELGWEEDVHQSNHLDASLRLITESLTSRSSYERNSDRKMYPRELVLDLKKRYHDTELDIDSLASSLSALPRHTSLPTAPSPISIQSHTLSFNSDRRENLDSRDKSPYPPTAWSHQWNLDFETIIHMAQVRQSESPIHDPHLFKTFQNLPILPGVQKVVLEIYESYIGFLPHIFRIVPNLRELVIRPNALLVESPLDLPSNVDVDVDMDMGARVPDCPWPRSLQVLRIEEMLDCLQPLVGELLDQGRIKHVVLSEQRGGRPKWTLSEGLAMKLMTCPTLGKIEVARAARSALQAGRVWPEGLVVEA